MFMMSTKVLVALDVRHLPLSPGSEGPQYGSPREGTSVVGGREGRREEGEWVFFRSVIDLGTPLTGRDLLRPPPLQW